MRTVLKRLAGLSVVALIVGAVIFASAKDTQAPNGPNGGPNAGMAKRGGGAGGPGGDSRQPVLVGDVKAVDLPIVLEGVGSARALNTVVVRAQVEGRILKFNVTEGQTVKKGDVIAEIDPTTYRAALDQAAAKKLVSETQLATARKDLERYGRVTAGVIAQKTVDTQVALASQLEAQVKADQAAVASAQAVLDFTRVVSPITGRTGLRQIDEGNIARASDQNGLVVVTEVQPIAVVFTLPQQQLTAVTRALATGEVKALAMDGESKVVLDNGTVQVLDNQVDQSTGTIKLKAQFPNGTLQLWPGQFVNVRLTVDVLRQVIAVPTPAVQRGPTGPFVFVVSADDTVAQRPVTLGVQTDQLSVATAGVVAGERVVTSGFARLQDGAKVTVGTPAPAAPPDVGASPPKAPGEGRQKRNRSGNPPAAEAPAPSAGTPSVPTPTQTATPAPAPSASTQQ